MPAASGYRSDPVPRALLSKEGCQRHLAAAFSWRLCCFPGLRAATFLLLALGIDSLCLEEMAGCIC